LAWIQERWVLVVGLVLFLLVVWLASGSEERDDNGRYVLVKDNVPCETVSSEGESDGRWCYLVLDTKTGRLEERVRRLRRVGRH
jgi:hypothetical protein